MYLQIGEDALKRKTVPIWEKQRLSLNDKVQIAVKLTRLQKEGFPGDIPEEALRQLKQEAEANPVDVNGWKMSHDE